MAGLVAFYGRTKRNRGNESPASKEGLSAAEAPGLSPWLASLLTLRLRICRQDHWGPNLAEIFSGLNVNRTTLWHLPFCPAIKATKPVTYLSRPGIKRTSVRAASARTYCSAREEPASWGGVVSVRR
jgi:hypothetical protein